jgi:protein tyrosine phosphatase
MRKTHSLITCLSTSECIKLHSRIIEKTKFYNLLALSTRDNRYYAIIPYDSSNIRQTFGKGQKQTQQAVMIDVKEKQTLAHI